MPPLVHLGPAAACGLTRYESDAFGAEFQRQSVHLLLQHAKADAAPCLLRTERPSRPKTTDFLVSNSLDFHPTDVLEDADGSLIVINTGGWYKLCCPTSQLWKPDILGAIYRIRRTGARTG